MRMTGYTKLFGSIVASTIWREPHTVRIVWITMLAMANKSGIVEASIPGLADLSRVSLDECKEAIAALSSPDEYSRTPDNEGRRILPVDGGWQILNHAKYRAKMGVDEKREYFRLKKQQQRALSKSVSNNVKDCPEKSLKSRHTEAQSHSKTAPQTEEGELPLAAARKDRGTMEEVVAFCLANGLTDSDGRAFFYGKEGNGWKNGASTVKDWRATILNWKARKWHPSQKEAEQNYRKLPESVRAVQEGRHHGGPKHVNTTRVPDDI